MMESKAFISNISVMLRNENGNLVFLSGQSKTFRFTNYRSLIHLHANELNK